METSQDHMGEQSRILMRLGEASISIESLERFKYRLIAGYPFLWVMHPGLPNQAIVIGYEHLLFLDHLGYVQIQTESLLPSGSFILTPSGLARCAELDIQDAIEQLRTAVNETAPSHRQLHDRI